MALSARLSAHPHERPELEAGDAAPDWTCTTFDGTEVRSADIHGKRALAVVFTGAPLGPDMTAALTAAHGRHKGALEIVLAVSVPNNWDKGAVVSFLDARGIAFPVTNDEPKELARLCGRRGAPEAVLVRRDGTIERLARADDPLWSDPRALAEALDVLVG